MSQDTVMLKVVYTNSRYPKGAFEAYAFLDGQSKTKQCALHVHDPEIAYQTVDLWAEDLAKLHKLTYKKKTKSELLTMIKNGGSRSPKTETDGISTGNNRSILSNKKYFKAEIGRVFEAIGYERLTEMFKVGTDHLNEINDEHQSRVENLSKAKEAMAQTMYQSYLDTSIDMSEFCSDEEIVNRFKALKENAGKLI